MLRLHGAIFDDPVIKDSAVRWLNLATKLV